MAELLRRLEHPDRSQLAFQVLEIAGDLTYLRHGVRLAPGDVVIDAGANVGVAAVFFAGLGATVHSFEPVAPIVEVLRRNVAALPACTVHPHALGSRTATGTVRWYPGATAMSGRHAEPDRDRELVRTALANLGTTGAAADAQLAGRYEDGRDLPCEIRRLSDVLREHAIDRVDLLKVDVERDEVEVLDGVDDADWPRIRQVAMEVHDVAGRLAELQRRLAATGFVTATEQDPAMHGTDVHVLHAVRP